MNEEKKKALLGKFREQFTNEEQAVITSDLCADLLERSIFEVTCCQCGMSRHTFAKPRHGSTSDVTCHRFMCPSCQAETIVVLRGRQPHITVVGAARILKLAEKARTKKWLCPKHRHQATVIAVRRAKINPTVVKIDYTCPGGPGSGEHSDEMQVDLLEQELELEHESVRRREIPDEPIPF